jgi:aminoglycoside phosphotransferase (APT) family kinase protein
LEATGANRIYATADVVLRVATDHPEAIADARTESIAAPAARQAGILTPQLIAFDDSRALVDRPFSIWERIHGETLGLAGLRGAVREDVWREAGSQIARLHDRVKACPDPDGYLDSPGRELTLDLLLRQFAGCDHANPDAVREIEDLISDLIRFVPPAAESVAFVHNDLHEWNVMCGRQGGLLALLDWGDAGWGDPALDFAAIPLNYVPAALEGYGDKARLGHCPEARIVWDHLQYALDDAIENPELSVPVGDYRRFLDAGLAAPGIADADIRPLPPRAM